MLKVWWRETTSWSLTATRVVNRTGKSQKNVNLKAPNQRKVKVTVSTIFISILFSFRFSFSSRTFIPAHTLFTLFGKLFDAIYVFSMLFQTTWLMILADRLQTRAIYTEHHINLFQTEFKLTNLNPGRWEMGSEIRRNMCRVLFSTHTAFKRTYVFILVYSFCHKKTHNSQYNVIVRFLWDYIIN